MVRMIFVRMYGLGLTPTDLHLVQAPRHGLRIISSGFRIAQESALTGYPVRLCDLSEDRLETDLTGIQISLRLIQWSNPR